MDRDQLQRMRPEIPGARTEETHSNEYFQNTVLRPVIKFQHDLILALVSGNEHFKLFIRQKGSRLEYQDKIRQFLNKQPEMKFRLIGAIVGLFTIDELQFYLKNQTDLNKRISQMICQRISDTLY